MTSTFSIKPLSSEHDRLAFSCGVDALDRYLKTQASQDVRRHIANCFIASPTGTTIVAGYYTLAAASIPILDLPDDLTRRLPRYPVLPAALIGRLAVDHQFRKRSLGAALLFDALERTIKAEPAMFAVVVDAKNEDVAAFYRHFGFVSFASRPLRLFLPVATAMNLMRS